MTLRSPKGRPPRHRRALAAAGAFTLFAPFAAGCTTNGATCDCANPGITVNIPADIASALLPPVKLSGAACEGVTASCPTQTGCTTYRLVPKSAGDCHIELDFDPNSSEPTFVADVTIVAGTGCCTGFFASPVSAAQIDVPASGDAGGP